MDLRDPSLIYETFSGKNFRAVIFISTFSDRRSLIIENDKNTAKTKMQQFDYRSFVYGIIGTKERVVVRQGIRAIRVRAIEVLLVHQTARPYSYTCRPIHF